MFPHSINMHLQMQANSPRSEPNTDPEPPWINTVNKSISPFKEFLEKKTISAATRSENFFF